MAPVAGPRVCRPDGSFGSGTCEPNRCSAGRRIAHSNYTCDGRTGDACEGLTCERGYMRAGGRHVCGASSRKLRAGLCGARS